MKSTEHLIVNIPKDIDSYEKKAILGMTLRQFKWVCIALGAGLAIYMAFMFLGLRSVGMLLAFCAGVGVFLLGGFQTWHGRPYADFVKAFIKFHRTQQLLTFHESAVGLDKEGGFDERKKTRKDRKINSVFREADF